VTKVAVASKTAPKAVRKAAFATESSGIESGAHVSGRRPRIQSGLFEPVADWEKRQAKIDEEWLQQQRIRRDTPTTAALITTIDATTNDDDETNERREVETINHVLEIYGIEMRPRLHSGDITINTKTTPCIVNHPCGSRRSVIPRRLHDVFVIVVSFFRELLSVALDTAHWCQERPMPTHWLVRELEKYKQLDEIMAEEIAIIIANGGILTLNPNKDWAAEGHEGTYLPIAITAGVFALPISRAQALRWSNDSEWGAEASVKVATKIHAPGQSDVERIKMRELGTHASHFCRRNREMADICRYR
jgi:hypothetical protein